MLKRVISIAAASTVGAAALLAGVPTASAAVRPALVSVTISPANVVITNPTTQHMTVTAILSTPADDLDALAIEPVTLQSKSIDFSNPSSDGITWVYDLQTSRYEWYYGTYDVGTFEVDWWEGAEYESTYHSNEAITAPPLKYTIKGATRLTIGKSRTVKRGMAVVVRGSLTRFDSVGFDGFANAKAVLQSRRPGRSWVNVATRTANAYSPVLAVSVKPSSTTHYRWLFTEKRDSKAATSVVMKVKVTA